MNPLTAEPDVCITLLRGIGIMTRENMMQRTERASDPFETPGAQCLGRQTFEWSYIPYAVEPCEPAPFRQVADTFFSPPLAVSYTHLRAHETRHDLVCRLLLE